MYPASDSSTSMSSLERKSPSSVRPRPRRRPCACLRPRAAHAAGQVVVQVQQPALVCCSFGQAQHLLRILQEDVLVASRRSKSRKPRSSERGPLDITLARPCDAASSKPGRIFRAASSDAASSCARKTATRVTSSVCGSRSTMESTSARRSVCEFRLAAKLDQRLAVVEALLVEHAIHPPWIMRFSGSKDRPTR
jgi:hypothetical protein